MPLNCETARNRANPSFRRGFADTFALDIVSRVFGLATLVVLVRGLSVSAYAHYTVFLAIATLAATAGGGGVRMRYLRRTAEQHSRDATAVDASSYLAALGTSTILMATMTGAGLVAGELVRASSYAPPVILLACVYAVGMTWGELAIAHHQALRRFLLAGAINVARAAALLAAALAATRTGPSITGALMVFAGTMLAIGIAASIPILAPASSSRRVALSSVRPTREDLELTLYYVVTAGFAYVDVFVAADALDDHAVASLGASLRYISLVLGMYPAINSVLKVKTSQRDVVDSLANQRDFLMLWLRRSAVPALLAFAVAVLAVPAVIPLVDGGRYPESHAVFQIYLVAAVAVYVTAPATNLLMAQRRLGWLTTIAAVALLVNFIGDVAVAPRFGITGIAVVSTAAYVAMEAVGVAAAFRGGQPSRR